MGSDTQKEPGTLLHGDPHIGNTYVLPDDEVGFLDWQVLRRGSFSLDLGYFLQGAVEIEDRRRCESDLIDEYQSALGLPADERPTRRRDLASLPGLGGARSRDLARDVQPRRMAA